MTASHLRRSPAAADHADGRIAGPWSARRRCRRPRGLERLPGRAAKEPSSAGYSASREGGRLRHKRRVGARDRDAKRAAPGRALRVHDLKDLLMALVRRVEIGLRAGARGAVVPIRSADVGHKVAGRFGGSRFTIITSLNCESKYC
jgi:hypothetical protein